MLRDRFGSLTVEITREQIEAWAGVKLTDDQIAELEEIIPNSSIPDAIGVIVGEAMGVTGEDDESGCQGHESLNGADMGRTVYCDGSCA